MVLSWASAACALLAAASTATGAPSPGGRPPLPQHHGHGEDKPPAFFLAGDSTTAVDGGWGNGFLAPLIAPAWGENHGKSGATTKSFIAEGRWANVTAKLKANAKKYDCYVTISFGHNDQKEASNVTFKEYQQNLINFANEVKSLGGKALLVSSLTRRVFASEHNVTDSLHDERLAALAAAEATGSTAIDLYAASRAYVAALGRDAAYAYNWGGGDEDGAPAGTDRTHLNRRGEVVFGRMVSDLVLRARPALGRWVTPNETLSEAIWNNVPARVGGERGGG
ncbi:carbohydrate esterase family 12 protein [Xylaria palmicola]|nr:carbohydrate esterase family 12 protein [Xylaria palmicola]